MVEVSTPDAETFHEVSLSNEYWQKLTSGKMSKEDLIKQSFEFLLQRESNTTILKHFNLSIINDYFPEFEEGWLS